MEDSLASDEIVRLRQEHYNATLTYDHRPHELLAIMRIRPDSPIAPHRAGQYTSIGLGYWEPRVAGCQQEELEPDQLTKVVKRAYSLSSPVLGDDGELLRPEDEDFLEFYVVLVRDAEKRAPALTPRLFALAEGSRLFVSEKITGHYTLDRVQPDHTVIMMATGTGEAPHNTMLLELLRRGHKGLITSVVCVRYQQDLGYFETHQKILARVPNYRYITLTTREEHNLQNKLYIQDLIPSGQLEERIGRVLDPASTHVFLCGNPNMIGIPKKGPDGQHHYPQPTGVIELLESRGFKADRTREPGNIHFEQYW
ncbi:MAG: ferredoxin--NADP reductase [Planctomycetes bacterium]|nr:ferredoxin--NADP reductase [Planctomycetota bacterium]